ncbi:MAG TPA: peptide chain release factor-like protein [Elusimicrobiales bacterium]|nr:peptide chain release factor-like protein [Elusimicrobiales bacterium]
MKFANFGNINTAKVEALHKRIAALKIDLNLIEESFSSGGGKGGQKINKTSNKVVLKYAPLNIVVSCQKERSRAVNRFLAIRNLVDKIELKLFPLQSRLIDEINRIKKRKSKRRTKARRKYG